MTFLSNPPQQRNSLLFLCFVILLVGGAWVAYDRSVDDFGPLHIGLAVAQLHGHQIPENIAEGQVAFYPFSGILSLTIGISDYRLPTLPLLLITYVTATVSLATLLAGNRWIGLIVGASTV